MSLLTYQAIDAQSDMGTRMWKSITERFVALGYTKSDTYKIRGHKEVFNDKALTDRSTFRLIFALRADVPD